MSSHGIINAKDKRVFGALIDKTRQCINNQKDGDDPLVCETAYLSKENDFTYHTHPNGTPMPSDIDRKTTARLNKNYLIIGLVPTRKVIVFSKNDGFNRIIAEFNV